jgi:hypothetical protein
MLIDIFTNKEIQHVPYAGRFETLRKRLSQAEFDAIVERINELIDQSGGKVATAGWLPGKDWTGTPFEPIFTIAARRDYNLSAQFFGQMVWYTIMHREERWASGRFEKDGVAIGSRTYFGSGTPSVPDFSQPELELVIDDEDARWCLTRGTRVVLRLAALVALAGRPVTL